MYFSYYFDNYYDIFFDSDAYTWQYVAVVIYYFLFTYYNTTNEHRVTSLSHSSSAFHPIYVWKHNSGYNFLILFQASCSIPNLHSNVIISNLYWKKYFHILFVLLRSQNQQLHVHVHCQHFYHFGHETHMDIYSFSWQFRAIYSNRALIKY